MLNGNSTFLKHLFSCCRVIGQTIASAYAVVCRKHCQTIGSSSSVAVSESTVEPLTVATVDLPRELFQMLAVAGPYLHRDTVLLQKV